MASIDYFDGIPLDAFNSASIATLAGVYGHEQQHIDNLRSLADGLRDALSEEEADIKCRLGKSACDSKSRELERTYLAKIGDVFSREAAHNIFVAPEDSLSYPPIGTMPGQPAGTIEEDNE